MQNLLDFSVGHAMSEMQCFPRIDEQVVVAASIVVELFSGSSVGVEPIHLDRKLCGRPCTIELVGIAIDPHLDLPLGHRQLQTFADFRETDL